MNKLIQIDETTLLNPDIIGYVDFKKNVITGEVNYIYIELIYGEDDSLGYFEYKDADAETAYKALVKGGII
jgi:hypothetical protein